MELAEEIFPSTESLDTTPDFLSQNLQRWNPNKGSFKKHSYQASLDQTTQSLSSTSTKSGTLGPFSSWPSSPLVDSIIHQPGVMSSSPLEPPQTHIRLWHTLEIF